MMKENIETFGELKVQRHMVKPGPQKKGTEEDLKHDHVIEVILLLRKNRIRLLITAISSFCISLLLFHFFYIKYTARVTFLIDDSDPSEIAASESERFALSQMNAINKNRMHLLIFSDIMVKKLDEQIKIGKHYNIRPEIADYYSQISERLKKNIIFRRDQLNTVSIDVKDHDKYFAPLLANTLFENLVGINRQVVLNNLNYKLGIYQLKIKQYQAKKEEDIQRMVEALHALPFTDKSTQANADAMFLMKRDIADLFSEYNKSQEELNKNELIYDLTADVLKDSTLQSLILINSAYPKNISGKYISATGWSVLIALVTVLYSLLSIYLVRKYKLYLRLLFKKNPSELSHL